jgi:hypothetical protein
MHRNEFFFQIGITAEQIALANQLVDYSIQHHPVQDVFAHDPDGKARQREFRFTGTIGEIVFADAYQLPRPTKSFGAIDGQDDGQDFSLAINSVEKSFDIKTMGRKNNVFRENYVLNLPAYQMNKASVITDYYFCISIHQSNEQWIASFLGYVSKSEIQAGTLGILYTKGTTRIKDDGGTFIFQRDTYEIDFKDITTPVLASNIEAMPLFERKKILPPFIKR